MNRPVNIMSLAFKDETPEQVFDVAEHEIREDTDIMLLPEMWMGDDYIVQSHKDDILQKVSEFARQHACYVISPLSYAPENKNRYNSSFVFDRSGICFYRYDKVFPWWGEFEFQPPCSAGDKPGLFQTDFGICGIAVCFDVNFPSLWAKIASMGAEIVFWPSDYSAGRSLQAHAMNHHYTIISATRERDTAWIDLTGDEISHYKTAGITAAHYRVDLDRSIFHENYNCDKLPILLNANQDIRVEQRLPREQWFILSGSKTCSVKDAARENGMEELRDYLMRSRREINPDFQ